MNQVKWYQKLGSPKATTLLSFILSTSILAQQLAVHVWHNEVMVWIPSAILFVVAIVYTTAWVRRVRES